MKKLKNLSIGFKEKFFFSRVNKKNFTNTINFINKHMRIKIKKNFYVNRYFSNKKFNSFICYNNTKIIAHVGYVQYLSKFEKNIIYSRHSSVVHKDYRNKKIYSNLLDYSFKNLSNMAFFLFWPNNNNKKRNFKNIKKNFCYKLVNNFIFFNLKKNKKLNKLNKLKNFKIFDKYYLINTYNNIIFKDKSYFKKRYFDLKNNKYYYDIFDDESLAIFTDNKFNKNPVLIELVGNKNKKKAHLLNLSKKFKFYYCVHPSKLINYRKFFNFRDTKIEFNFIYLTNEKLNMKNYDIHLADTDSFLKTI